MPYLSTMSDGSLLMQLHVQPKASKSRMVGLHDGCLKLAVSAPPEEGKANKQVVKLLSAQFGVSGRDIVLKSGFQSRRKQVIVKGIDEKRVRNIVSEVLGIGK